MLGLDGAAARRRAADDQLCRAACAWRRSRGRGGCSTERFAARQLGHFFSLSLSWRARPFAVAMALGVSAHSLAASSLGSDG